MRLVEVVWRDARFALDEPVGITELRTVGWLVEEHDTHVLVAGERATTEEYFRAYTAIPRECVVTVNTLVASRSE